MGLCNAMVSSRMRRWLSAAAAGVLLGGSARAFEGYSDPLRPPAPEGGAGPPVVPLFSIPDRLKQVELEITRETKLLEELAPLQAAKQFDHFGYHSDYIPAVDEVPQEPLWTLTFNAGMYPTLGFVMVPAIDQRSSDLKGYAFPRRFRICSENGDAESGRVYVDWTERDFPDPGMRPVYFGFPPADAPMERLRLEVYAGHEENGLEFFALGRVHQIRQNELQKVELSKASSSFDSAPYWDGIYLGSPRYTLGMPLSGRQGTGGNLVVQVPAARLEEPLVIRVELDEETVLGWINLYPGESPDGIDVPGYGFPQTMNVYRVVRRNAGDKEQRFPVADQDALKNPGSNMIRLPGGGVKISALEVECNDFPVYQGQAAFSLGEIEIVKQGLNLSKGRPVSVRGVDLEHSPDLGMLVDGAVGGRTILRLPDWLHQLAEGKPHEARLEALKGEQRLLTERWQRFRRQGLTGIGMALITGIAVFFVLMLRGRKKAVARLRRQIYSDLHDEVGSNLGSISLMAGQLERLASDARIKDGVADLALMAREAGASLREVVWMIDQSTIRLPALVQKLVERVERVLNDAELEVDIPERCPELEVSLKFKRHLIMFLKEAVHNCARHAHAARVRLSVAVSGQQLEIALEDNGCGFDDSAPSDGWGVSSMQQRAQEMGGAMTLSSTPGEGTAVRLSVPLAAFSKNPDNAYKTSN